MLNLLSACIKAEGCQGGVLADFLPNITTHLKRIGKLWNGAGTKFTYINLISVKYKDGDIAQFETIRHLQDIDLMDIPETAWT